MNLPLLTQPGRASLAALYRSTLLEDVIPFWLRHGLDREQGGYLTGDEKYARWHQDVHDWSFDHFTDRKFGEWYGYLHRDGRVSVSLKGNLWKGPFHLPRMLWYCWRLLDAGASTAERAR